MSAATLCLSSREALELHFEGICYGPIAHTQALGALLFALRPERVVLAAAAPKFAIAMQRVLAAAEATVDVLATWQGRQEADEPPQVSARTLAVWLHACCETAPAPEARNLRSKLTARLGDTPWRDETLH